MFGVTMTIGLLPFRDYRKISFSLIVKIFSIVIPLSFTVSNVDGQAEEVAIRRGLYSITNNARWSNPLSETPASSLVECADCCHDNKLCAAVNFQASTKICEQVGYPLDSAPVSSDGWRTALLNEPMMIQVDMNGAVARQSSALDGWGPEKGIDGDTRGYDEARACFHTLTSYSWWLVELPQMMELTGVTIYLRSNCCFHKQGKLRFLVSSSRQDSDAGIETDVGFYEGPPTPADNPLQIVFRGSIFGKIFKIKHELNDDLHLCEIVLLSPSY